jgi:hypothetical protein
MDCQAAQAMGHLKHRLFSGVTPLTLNGVKDKDKDKDKDKGDEASIMP